MSRESYHVAWLLRKLRGLPGTWWTRVEQRNIRGTPDILGCVHCSTCGGAKIVALEAKTEKGNPSELQRETIERLSNVGAFARIVRLPRDYDELIKQLKKYYDGQ